MCGTCGCGHPDGPTIATPQEARQQHHHHHSHDHNHPHSHEHPHSPGHTHSHASRIVEVEQDVLHANALGAARNRGFFEARQILALNLVSSPGSGKTTLLERTVAHLKAHRPVYVIEGDQQTFHDAERIEALEVPVVQVNTGKGCHLESDMIFEAVKKLDPTPQSFLFIENVGNLVCPAMFDLGEHRRVVIISITEGDDKPLKYPDMFHTAHLCLINKMDLQPYINADIDKIKDYARRVNPHLDFIEISATRGDGMEAWYDWLHRTFAQTYPTSK